MSIETLKQSLPEAAKDIKINLNTLLTEEGAPGLTPLQTWTTALACAYATKSPAVIAAIYADSAAYISEADTRAAQIAATMMAMNNVYYRAMHLIEDPALKSLPVGLRMQTIGNPGVDKGDFELYCLAVSAINGCGACLVSHTQQVLKHGVSHQGIQSSLRIASVVTAAAQASLI
jgi:lipoyl-dependent peroxiredoxin subunit D